MYLERRLPLVSSLYSPLEGPNGSYIVYKTYKQVKLMPRARTASASCELLGRSCFQVLPNVESTVEHAQDVYVAWWFNDVSDAVMTVKQRAYVSISAVAVADFREARKNFCAVDDSRHSSSSGTRIVCSDVVVNLFEPALRFGGPGYFRHVSSVRFI